jgi:alpha-ketoglutaric semialdehyde dehydrogenase
MSRTTTSPELTGAHWISGKRVSPATTSFQATRAADGTPMEPKYGEATETEIDDACQTAAHGFQVLRQASDETRARLLEAIADQVMAANDDLLQRCHLETGLPFERLEFERTRTVNQARLFAQVVREGSWAEPRIDHADQQAGGRDCRSRWFPVGPVAVFGASNFPLAISVVGNDTVAALAAGCSVVVKAHPGHPGTCEILAGCLNRAIEACGLPPEIFSLLHGATHEVGRRLVQHPSIQAVGFTGSLTGGRALFDAVCQRPQWIPVYAEMGSVNPVFLFPSALQDGRWQRLTQPLAGSISAGCGQMCTQPGLVLGVAGRELTDLQANVGRWLDDHAPYTLLHPGIARAYRSGTASRESNIGVSTVTHPSGDSPQSQVSTTLESDSTASVQSARNATTSPGQTITKSGCQVNSALFQIDSEQLLNSSQWEEEIFGPTSTFVHCHSLADMLSYAERMKGSLTASVFAANEEYEEARRLIAVLQQKVGRIIFNGMPTGVLVNHAMMHGGPYPAAIGSFTSIGTGSIKRFARPVCLQEFPNELLPDELRDDSTSPALRLIDGKYAQMNSDPTARKTP